TAVPTKGLSGRGDPTVRTPVSMRSEPPPGGVLVTVMVTSATPWAAWGRRRLVPDASARDRVATGAERGRRSGVAGAEDILNTGQVGRQHCSRL
ncbi:MAG: hypothetical protein RL148_1748, partial [Planctomycetota bacterium]